MKPELAKPWEEQTIDTIYLLFTSYKKFPDVVKHKFIKKNLKVDDLICEESVTHIADILIVSKIFCHTFFFYIIYN